jgi:UPF0271 protein
VKKVIDINADLGEGSGNDEKLMPLISSCSIACGGHYGDEKSMLKAIRLAKKHNVLVGVHPSFADSENFGRKIISITEKELSETIFQQITNFKKLCVLEGISIHHVKLHGALYNLSSVDDLTAEAVLKGILKANAKAKLYVPYDSKLAIKAKKLLPLVYEAFIDRRYNDDLTLVKRNIDRAIITNAEDAWNQLFEMVMQQKITTNSGLKKEIIASSFCVHGDHVNAVEILKYLRMQMKIHSIYTS